MNDIEKRALWLLCGECDLDEEDYCDSLLIVSAEALRAVVAALTPPEGYVLVPAEPTDDWKKAVVRAALPGIKDETMGMLRLIDELEFWHSAMLAARPEVAALHSGKQRAR